MLIGAGHHEPDALGVDDFRDGATGGHGVVEEDGFQELDVQLDEDGAQAGDLAAQDGGDDGRGEDAVGDAPTEDAFAGVFFVDVQRVEITRRPGEGEDVGLDDGFGKGAGVADLKRFAGFGFHASSVRTPGQNPNDEKFGTVTYLSRPEIGDCP